MKPTHEAQKRRLIEKDGEKKKKRKFQKQISEPPVKEEDYKRILLTFASLEDYSTKQLGELILREIETQNLTIISQAERVTKSRKQNADQLLEDFKKLVKEKEEKQKFNVMKATIDFLSSSPSSDSPSLDPLKNMPGYASKSYRRWGYKELDSKFETFPQFKLSQHLSIHGISFEIKRSMSLIDFMFRVFPKNQKFKNKSLPLCYVNFCWIPGSQFDTEGKISHTEEVKSFRIKGNEWKNWSRWLPPLDSFITRAILTPTPFSSSSSSSSAFPIVMEEVKIGI